MPVVDGVFVPHGKLVLAETTVDFEALNEHIITRRLMVEQQALAHARRVAHAVTSLGLPTPASLIGLEQALEQSLRRTARFGMTHAQQEIRRLRDQEPIAGSYQLPDAGRYAREARDGLPGILRLIRRRARETAQAVGAAAAAAVSADDTLIEDETNRLIVAVAAVKRSLHNHVLELVGEVLNLGRTAGALTLTQPPTFAMRSEQLDKSTCAFCSRAHGEILEVGSPSYFEYLPPAGCYGGGRCRGLMVFADRVTQVRGPDTAPGPQPDLPLIPPVRFPERRVA